MKPQRLVQETLAPLVLKPSGLVGFEVSTWRPAQVLCQSGYFIPQVPKLSTQGDHRIDDRVPRSSKRERGQPGPAATADCSP